MTRVLEFVVALVMVFVLAVIVGVLLPSHGHVERSIEISHDMEHVVDVLNNFRRFPDYSVLRSLDPNTRFELSGAPYGVGAAISWHSDAANVGDGRLEITSSTPQEIVWKLDNNWHGTNKHFTIDLSRTSNQRLVKIDWAYDVDYGWDLISRYSQLFLHGDPASFIQYGEDNLASMLANIPNIGYAQLDPRLVETPAQPVLSVSTQAQRNLNLITQAQDKAIGQIHDAMKKLGVKATGQPVVITTNWGDQDYTFDVVIPIDTTTITIDGEEHDLTQLPQPGSNGMNPAAGASAPAPAGTAAPAAATSSGMPAMPGMAGPGQINEDGELVVNDNVNAYMAFGGRALAADWPGNNPAGLPLARLGLKAYASTHGYAFNEYVNRFYDILNPPSAEEAAEPAEAASSAEGEVQPVGHFTVFLPVQSAPAETPAQAADRAATGAGHPAAAGSVAPAGSAAPAASALAPAASAPATPGSAQP